MPEVIFITTDGYHYESVLETVASGMSMVIKRQRCLFHIEKDLAHKIKEAEKEKDLDMARKLIRYMFFQTEKNLKNMGNNMESVIKLTDGKNEGEIVGIIMDKVMKSYLISLTLLRNT